MEDVLEVYAQPYDARYPVLCMDEQPGSVSKVEMTTPRALICEVLFPFISTFETLPTIGS